MERTLTNFIRALRSSEVRVSTGEALDATRAVALIGYADRSLLKESLGCVLAKSEQEKQVHDRLFDLYFSHSEIHAEIRFQRRRVPNCRRRRPACPGEPRRADAVWR